MSRRSKFKLSPALLVTGVGVAIMLAIAGAYLWADTSRHNLHNAEDAAAYAASGPPCPTTTPEALAVGGPHLRQAFEFGDMILSYASGGVDCAWFKGQEGSQAVCKFDSPGALGAKLKGRQIVFASGIGKSAAIVRQGDTLSCVMIPRIN